MANAPLWLKKYYGADFDYFSPEIIKEGKTWSLVKLSRSATRGYSSIGYVLIKRNGMHSASKYISLHEGLPTQVDMDRMLRVLAQEDDD